MSLLAAEDAAPSVAESTPDDHDDNGTNPTRVSRTMLVKYEYLKLRNGGQSDILRFQYTHPLGDGWSVTGKLPVAYVDTTRASGSGLGDVSVEVGKIFGLDKEGGHVVRGEVFFDTATRRPLDASAAFGSICGSSVATAAACSPLARECTDSTT